ncbi:MAG: hypothetical protein ACTSYO_08145 [Candidatus Ranarchaeia archaeon]
MKITENQMKVLGELSGKIQKEYGLTINYINPAVPVSMIKDDEADFIIYENQNAEDIMCFYKDDIQARPQGPYMVRVLPNDPKHDSKVQDLIDRLNDDLIEGKIWFDPCHSKVENGLIVEVTQKIFPGTDNPVYNTNIFTEKYGTVYTYELICEFANYDKKFKIARDIIDKHWPQPEPEIEPESKIQGLGKITEQLRKFLYWFF